MPAKIITPRTRAVSLRFVQSYEKLRYLGIEKNKVDFAQKVGTSATNLLRIEKNETSEPSLNSIVLLFDVYNVNPEWLFFGKGDFLRK